jgi:hypothetical protein
MLPQFFGNLCESLVLSRSEETSRDRHVVDHALTRLDIYPQFTTVRDSEDPQTS